MTDIIPCEVLGRAKTLRNMLTRRIRKLKRQHGAEWCTQARGTEVHEEYTAIVQTLEAVRWVLYGVRPGRQP